MRMLYDTSTVHPLDRYDYYRASAASEIAPVVIHGCPPGTLFAAMSTVRIGEFEIAVTTWAADAEVVAQRTDRLIRTSDPGCYRLAVSVTGGIRVEQAGNRVRLRTRDIGLYDTARPWRSTHTSGMTAMRVVLLTFPRTLLPVSPSMIRPLLGTAMPRGLPGRDVVADFLVGLADNLEQAAEPGLVDALRECVVGLIRQRLGLPNGITPETRRLLYLAHIRGIIQRNLRDPALGVDRIAKAAHISPRYLHKLFQGTGLTPMQLLKQLRLEECRRSLQDPALLATPVKNLITARGYLRPDQFARDFRAQFGVSAREIRRSARHRRSGCEG